MSSDTFNGLAIQTGQRDALPPTNASVLPLCLKAGDPVVVRSPQEILQTLDPRGTLDNLPFMPEMLEFCGKRFAVLNRVVQSTIDGAFLSRHKESFVREFHNNDVVTLQGVRCSGQHHDCCQRACAIFWKEAWLKRATDDDSNDGLSVQEQPQTRPNDLPLLLKTKTDDRRYFCQSSEFLKATRHLSSVQRIKKCFSAVAVGNISALGMLKRLLVWMRWKLRYKFIGEHVSGTLDKTPTAVLDLQPGDLVEIRPLSEIVATLNKYGRNRGLHFSADQRPFCGKRYRVRNRADNFIAEGTGEMKHLHNTVMLEDVLCDSACFAFGGCYRSDLLYWREIWLRKSDPGLDSSTWHPLETTVSRADIGTRSTVHPKC
jgi:hypothetical protein